MVIPYFAFEALFALILVTGIVIDATIIVVENIHRHFKMAGRSSLLGALQAIQELVADRFGEGE